MTDAELKAELALPAYAGKTIPEKVAALNAPKQGVTFPVIVPKAKVLEVMAMAPFRVGAMPEAQRIGWLESLDNIRSLEQGITPSDAGVAALLAQAVTDGILTSGEKAALDQLGQRLGSRAEELWGEGFVVSLNDVARVS